MANPWDAYQPANLARQHYAFTRGLGQYSEGNDDPDPLAKYNSRLTRGQQILAEMERGQLRAGWSPKSANTPTMEQWWNAGNRPVGGNSAYDQYFDANFNMPSYAPGFLQGIAPIVAAAALPVMGAAGYFGEAVGGGVGAGGGFGGGTSELLPALETGSGSLTQGLSLTGGPVTGTSSMLPTVTGGAVGGGNVSEFFPDIINTGFIDPNLGSSILDTQFSNLPALDTPTGLVTEGVTDAGLNSGIPGFESGSFFGNESFFSPTGSGFNISGDNLKSLTKLLMGGDGNLSSLFGNRGVLGTTLALAPALAAINYAKNQGPFDTSNLTADRNAINPDALALPYDIQSAKGRDSLTSSLTNRNVMGSSFGNQDLASYDMLRHAGRQNILTSGVATRAGIDKEILDAQVKERLLKNDLYGRALMALSGGLSPRSSIFAG